MSSESLENELKHSIILFLKSTHRFLILYIVFLFCFESWANIGGKYRWEEMKSGGKYLFYASDTKDGHVKFHVASVNLKMKGLKVVVSPPRYIGSKTSQFASAIKANFAINGGFWTLVTHHPLGLVVSEGRKWRDSKDDEEYGFLAVGDDGSAWISPPEEVVRGVSVRAANIISGAPMIVKGGRVGKVKGCGYICMKHPRSAVGLDRTGETLFLAVADGRQPDSASISLGTFAEFLIDIGVWDALNLDGGGSSTLYVKEKGGVVNNPCEGKERSVMNSLAVIIEEGTERESMLESNTNSITKDGKKINISQKKFFTEADFEKKGVIGFPPRFYHFAGIGFFSIVVLVITLSSITMLFKRCRKR